MGTGKTAFLQGRWYTKKDYIENGNVREVYILSYIYIYHTIKEDMRPNYKKATGGHVQDVHGSELDGWTESRVSPPWSEAETWRSKRAAKTRFPVITIPVRAARCIPLYHHQTDVAANKTKITSGWKRSPPIVQVLGGRRGQQQVNSKTMKSQKVPLGSKQARSHTLRVFT